MEVTASNVTRLPDDNHDPARFARRLDGWWQLVEAGDARLKITPDPTEVKALFRDSYGRVSPRRFIVASAKRSADGGLKSMASAGSSTSTSITISTPLRTTPSTRA